MKNQGKMHEALTKIDRNHKIRLLQSVMRGDITPDELKQKFNANKERELPVIKHTITLTEKDGKYFDITGDEIPIKNNDFKSFLDELYPEQQWKLILLHLRNYRIPAPIRQDVQSVVTTTNLIHSFDFNEIYQPVFSTKARYIDIWGGRARGGSHFGTDYFLFLIMQPKYFRGCFLRAIYSDVRGSLWQDFKDRVDRAVELCIADLNDFSFHESTMTVTYKPTGNTIISKGFKKAIGTSSAKLKSLAGMTHVLIEECEEVAEEDFNKLDDSIRTTKVEYIQVIRLFNPPSKNHWLIKRNYNLIDPGINGIDGKPLKGWYRAVQKDIPELLAIHSTYLDNISNVNQSTINNYRNYGDPASPKYNEDFYYRDVLGLVSEGRKGRILTHVKPMTYQTFRSLPYPSFFGIDWGFNDPNAVLECKYHDGRLFWHELIYKSGMDNEELMIEMRAKGVQPHQRTYYDSARPDNAKTFKKGIEYGPKAMKGFKMIPSLKGPNSITYGISELKNVEIFATEGSENLWNEIQEYHWEMDERGQPTDEPADEKNHLIDAARYAFIGEVRSKATVKAANTYRNDSKLDWIEEVKIGPLHRDHTDNYKFDDDDVEDFYK